MTQRQVYTPCSKSEVFLAVPEIGRDEKVQRIQSTLASTEESWEREKICNSLEVVARRQEINGGEIVFH